MSEAREQQTATADVLKVISSSPGELEPVFNAMLENATRICEAKFGTLYRYDGGAFHPVTFHKVPSSLADFLRQRGSFVPPARTPLDLLLRTRNVTHVVDDGSAEPVPGAAATHGGARVRLAVPMLKDNELVGAILIYRQEVRPFTDKQIELVKNFAAQAVIAIENTRLLNELRKSLQQQTATADVLKVISRSTFDLQGVLDTLAQSAVNLCEADQAVIRRRVGDSYPVAATCGFTQQQREHLERYSPKPGRGSVFGRTIVEGCTVHIPDVSADPEWERADQPRVTGIRAAVGVPLLREGVIVGILVVIRTEPRAFSQKQIELLETFADQAVIAIENVRLFEEVQQRTRELSVSLEQQTATSEVLSAISTSPGKLQPVFEVLLENATRICEARFGNLVLYENKAFQMAAMYGAPPAFAEKRGREPVIQPGPKNPLARVAETRRLLHIADLRADVAYVDGDMPTRAFVELAGTRTIVVVPMLKDNELIGAIGIYRQEVRPFTDKQIELLNNFAAQAVIAIENTRLLNELRQRTDDLTESLEQQTATAEILQTINRSPGDVAPVFDAMVESAMHFCQADYGHVYSYDGEFFHLIAAHGEPRYLDWIKQTGPRLPENSLTLERVISGAPFVHIADIAEDDTYRSGNPRARTIVDKFDIHTLLTVALRKEDKLLGSFVLYRRVARPFSEKQVALVQNFATQAVIAMENARLLIELRQRTNDLSESLQQQTATADVLKVISRSTFDLRAVLQTLVESAARLCDADKAIITRQKEGVFYRAEAYGFSREFMDQVRDTPIKAERGSGIGRALLEGRVIHIPDVKADPEFTFMEHQKLGDFRTVLAVPMLREGVPRGIVTLTRSEVRPFTDKQIELATTFADQAAIAIENVRLFESVEARTRELAASLENLQTTQDRLVQTQKLASLGQLTAGIAHEIKNPLNFVNNFSGVSVELIDELRQALAGANLDTKLRAEISEIADTLQGNLDKVVQHGKRADAIVKNMLLHSREGSGEHRLVDINAVVEESLNLAYHGARAEKQDFNITLQQSLDPAAGEVDVFPQDITRVLLNLISNGFYAATKRRAETNGGDYEPTLSAGTRSLGDRVEITIRDNGAGIPPDVKEKMFNPFFTTKPAGEGTGLGLSISHDIIVKQHGGSIEVETQPGEFTEIRIILPRTAVFV